LIKKRFDILIYKNKKNYYMKTKVEINGYEIEIEFIDGMINVVASKDGEAVEEFSIETEAQEGAEGEESEEIQGFGEFDEEEDFEGDSEEEFEGQDDEDEDEFEGQDEEDEDDDEEENPNVGAALESFQSFLKKSNKRK
jgi:hypothetical protein